MMSVRKRSTLRSVLSAIFVIAIMAVCAFFAKMYYSPHSHAAELSNEHDEVFFEGNGAVRAITQTDIDGLSLSGYNTYYLELAEDVVGTLSITDGAVVYLCLNGHSLSAPTNQSKSIISVNDATLNLYDCKGNGCITGATDYSDSKGGAVILYAGATFNMYSGTIKNNRAEQGGGVYVDDGSFTMSGGEISGNISTKYGGAGVFVNGSNCTFTMCGGIITGNTATTGNGGGVHVVNGGKIIVYGSPVVTGNSANGGETVCNVSLDSNNVLITVSDDNRLTYGANIGITRRNYSGNETPISGYTQEKYGNIQPYNFFTLDTQIGSLCFDDKGNVVVVDSVIDPDYQVNVAVTVDGAEYYYETIGEAWDFADGKTATVKLLADCTVSAELTEVTSDITLDLNSFTLELGGTNIKIANGGELTLEIDSANGKITGGGNSTVNGGAIYIDGGTFTMNGGTLSGNSAKNGGAVYLSRGSFVMAGGSITDNTLGIGGNGGGVYLYSGTFTMTDGVIGDNKADANGGGVCVYGSDVGSSTFEMIGGTISGNSVDDGYGGGVYVAYKSTFTMKGGVIENNDAFPFGGGVYVAQNGTFTMSGGEISGNTSDTYGGGVYVAQNGSFTMSGGELSGNTSESDGGGVYVAQNGSFTMSDGEISGNNASNGGAIYLTGGATVVMNGGSISDNTAKQNGGGVYVSFVMSGSTIIPGKFTLNDGKVSDNNANTYAGVFVNGGAVEMSGGEISKNRATSTTGGVAVNGGSFSMTGGKISENTAQQYGGVTLVAGTFTMSGGEITGNSATFSATSGVVLVNGNVRFELSGNAKIYGNKYSNAESNICFMNNAKTLAIVGAFESGAKIGVTLPGNGTGVFTTDYAKYNGDTDPADYFVSDNSSYSVMPSNGEVGVFNVHRVNFYDEDSKLLDGPIIVVEGEKVVYTGELPTKADDVQYTYTFGWYEKSGEEYSLFNIATMSVTRDLDLYGLFKETLRTYNVSVDNINGLGTVNGALKTVPYGTTITVNGNTLKFSYGSDTSIYILNDGSQVLDGWIIDGELREDGYVYTVTGNTEIAVVVRQKVVLKWTYLNEEVDTRVYSGASDRGNVKVVFTDINGGVIYDAFGDKLEYTGQSSEVKMTASNGKTVMQDVGTYTFTFDESGYSDKYIFSGNEFVFEITPYIIDLSDENNYKWTLSGYGSELRDGTVYVYEVDGVMRYYYAAQTELGTPYAEIDVVRSIVRYRGDDVTLTIDLNNGAIPQLFVGGGNRTTVVYSGACSANDLGAYDAVATLTLNDSVNYKYIAGDINSKRGMTIDIRDNGATAVINKTWYVVTIRNGLLTPDGTDEYRISDFTFGDNIDVAAPVLEHGTLTDDNATFTLSYIDEGNSTVNIGTFKASELTDNINKSMPAGRYVLLISVDVVTDGEGIAYEAFTRTFDFTVAKADMSRFITDSAKGKTYVYGYTGELQLHADGDLTVALPYVDGADRIGVWKDAKYDKYYSAEFAYSMLRWGNRNYRTVAELNSQVTASQKPVNVGEYTVFYRITSNNFVTYGGDIDGAAQCFYYVDINKTAYDTSDWGFDKDKYEFVYDGGSQADSVKVKDNIPSGVVVTYTVKDENGDPISTLAVVAAGTYTLTATFVGDGNHADLDFACSVTLIISPKEIHTDEIVFADKTFVYSGSQFGLPAISDLPEGVTVEYSRNSFSAPDRYEIVAYLSTDSNHVLIGGSELSAYMYILATDLIVYVGNSDVVLATAHNDKGFAYGTQLKVEQIGNFTSDLIDGDILAAFDIKLVDADGNAVQPNGTITLRLLIPEALRDIDVTTLGLVHIHNDNASEITFTVSDGYAVFSTGSLSEFVFVVLAEEDPEDQIEPITPDEPRDAEDPNDTVEAGTSDDGQKSFFVRYWWLWLIILLLLILIVIIIIVVVNRRKDDGDDETAAVAPVPAPIVAPAMQATENVDASPAAQEPTAPTAPVEEIKNNAEEESAAAAAALAAAEEARQAAEEARKAAEQARKAAEEEAARKAAEEEAKKKERAAKAKATREANAAKRKAEQEAAAALAAERQAEEEAARKAAEEQAARKAAEEEAKRKERAAKAKATREANAAKRKAEQEAAAALAAERQAEEEAARKAAEEEAARKAAEEEAKRKERAAKAKATREANAAKRKAEEEARKAEEEAARKAAEEQAARKAAEDEAKRKERAAKAKAAREARAAAKAAERERIAAEEAQKLLADEQAAALIEESEEKSDRTRQCIVNIDILSKYFDDGETVTLNELKNRIPKFDSRATYLKVLARGTLDKKLNVIADSFSLDAVKMIVLTGGSATRKGKK